MLLCTNAEIPAAEVNALADAIIEKRALDAQEPEVLLESLSMRPNTVQL